MIQNKQQKKRPDFSPLDVADPDKPLKKSSFIGGIFRFILELIVLTNLVLFTTSFFAQGCVIDSGSMTPTLYEGDVMVVNILSTGRKSPRTLFSLSNLFPFLRIPDKIFGIPTFWSGFSLPRLKVKGYGKMQNGDIIMFQNPAPQHGDRKTFNKKPIDHRLTVAKRGYFHGTTIETKNAMLYVNGSPDPRNAKRQFKFVVTMPSKRFNQRLGSMLSSAHKKQVEHSNDGTPRYEVILTPSQIDQLLKNGENVFNSPNWKLGSFQDQTPQHQKALKEGSAIDRNNVKPFRIPWAGLVCLLNKDTHPLILESIQNENPDFRIDKGLGKRPDRFFIGQKEIDKYTFKKNHCLPIGDNFHNSFDGLAYGTIPEEYIRGRNPMVLFGTQDNNLFYNIFTLNFRTGRFFKSID